MYLLEPREIFTILQKLVMSQAESVVLVQKQFNRLFKHHVKGYFNTLPFCVKKDCEEDTTASSAEV